MKDSYTIHEIAALYGVGPDALRYYEKLGLIRPRRAENGYRIYDLNDIYRLTILRDQLSLICPNLSRMRSIRLIKSGKELISFDSLYR